MEGLSSACARAWQLSYDHRPRRVPPQCTRPAPAARRAERVARAGWPARLPPALTSRWRGEAGGWTREKGFIFPILATILPRAPHRVLALFYKACLVEHQDPIRGAHLLGHELMICT